MPQAVAAWVVAYVGAVGASAAAITAVVEVVVTVALSLAVSAITQALAGKPSTNAANPARTVTAKGTIQFRQLIYGQVRTGGFLSYYGTSGTNNNYLWFAVAVAGHECEAIDDCWLDTRHILNSDITGGTGAVTAAAFQGHGASRLSIWKHLGGSAQTVDLNLWGAFGEWDTSHIGFGIPYVIYRLDRDDTAYPAGAPSAFYQLVKGRKLYDPRLDSTNGGSGSQRVTDASTWVWSQNWALAVRDYLSGGAVVYASGTPDKRLTVGEDDARIDDAYIIAAANHADEAVTVPLPVLPGTTNWTNGSVTVTGNGTLFTSLLAAGNKLLGPDGATYTIAGSPAITDTSLTLTGAFAGTTVVNEITHYSTSGASSVTEARFTADCQLSCGNTHAENLSVLLSGGNGHIAYVGGKYRLFAGVYTAPSVTLTQDDFVGPLDILTHDPMDKGWNYVTGTFFDETNNWTESPFPAQQDPAYETADGRQYSKAIDLQATRGVYRAQRLAQVVLQQGRNQLTISAAALSQRAVQIGEWDTFYVTIPECGWTNQIFRCITWKFLASGLIAITARSESSSAYADPALGAYVDPSTNNPPAFVTSPPDAPTGLFTVPLDGEVALFATAPAYFPATQFLEFWEYTSNAPFSSATLIGTSRSSRFDVAHSDSTTRYYWVTVGDVNGGRSASYPSGAGVSGFATQNIHLLDNSWSTTAQWLHLGTLVLNAASSANFEWSSGSGYNTGQNQQAISGIQIRASNSGSAPNLAGISVVNTGHTAPIGAVKAAATGGSTSPSNTSWEIYADVAPYTSGPLEVILNPSWSDSFIFDGSVSTDPGPASSTVVVGYVAQGLDAVAGSGLDALPDGTTFARFLAAGLTSGIANRSGLTANSASLVVANTAAGTVTLNCPVSGAVQDTDVVTATVVCDGSTLGIDVSSMIESRPGHLTSMGIALYTIRRDGADIGTASFDAAAAGINAGASGNFWQGPLTLTVLDTPAAGSHTYALHMHGAAAGTSGYAYMDATNSVLKVREYFK